MKSTYTIKFMNADADRIARNIAKTWGEIISENTPGMKVTLTPMRKSEELIGGTHATARSIREDAP